MNGMQLTNVHPALPYLTPADIKNLKAQADEMAGVGAAAPTHPARTVANIAKIAAAYWDRKRSTNSTKGT